MTEACQHCAEPLEPVEFDGPDCPGYATGDTAELCAPCADFETTGAPFTVHYGFGSTALFATFSEAMAKWRTVQPATITGDGVDFDCDGDGFFACSTGLTEAQRERIAEEL